MRKIAAGLAAALGLAWGAAAWAQEQAPAAPAHTPAPASATEEAVPGVCFWKQCFGVTWRTPNFSDVSRLDPQERSIEGRTPLHYAALNCAPKSAFDVLVFAGADINEPDPNNGLTPLQTAISLCSKGTIENVLDYGADVNAIDAKVGGSTFHYAVWKRAPAAVLKMLVDRQANINAKSRDGMLPLIYFLALDDMDMFDYLLQAGANPNVYDNNGIGPVHIAAKRNDLEMLSRLRSLGANLGAATNQGKTPLHILAAAGLQPEHIAIFRLAEIDPNQFDNQGLAPVHYAAQGSPAESVVGLLLLGVSPNMQDKHGNTPLHYALHYNEDPDLIKALLRVGADPNFPDADGTKPVEIAINATGDWQIVKQLIEAGASPHLVGPDGRTLLHRAIAAKNPELALSLIEGGANPHQKDMFGDDAFALVGKYGIVETALNAYFDQIKADEQRALEEEEQRQAEEDAWRRQQRDSIAETRARNLIEARNRPVQVRSVLDGERRAERVAKRMEHVAKQLRGANKAGNERKVEEYKQQLEKMEEERRYFMAEAERLRQAENR